MQGIWKRVALAALAVSVAGCGNTYRPVVTAINPVGPAAQPTKYAVAIASNGTTNGGVVSIVDVSGDTVLDTTAIGVNPYYVQLSNNGGAAYTLNGDGTVDSFSVSTGLRANAVSRSTLLPGALPVAIYDQNGALYFTTPGRNSVAQLTEAQPPVIQQELTTGAGVVYTVGAASSARAYAIVQGASGAAGHVAAIETSTSTISATLPVGVQPVYGVMTADSKRAFILNRGSNSVTVVNAQKNTLDTFTNLTTGAVSSTIPVGLAPVWADFAPTLNELVVANAGDGTNPGSVTIVSIPLCSATSVTGNPTCDAANPIDAVGFGAVLANIPVGVNPVVVGVLQDGTQAFVANAGNAAAGIAGSVSVINLATNTVIATISGTSSGTLTDALIHGHPNFIAVTTGTPTGKVYVTSSDSNDMTILRTDTDLVQTHVSLQGAGVMVRVTSQ